MATLIHKIWQLFHPAPARPTTTGIAAALRYQGQIERRCKA